MVDKMGKGELEVKFKSRLGKKKEVIHFCCGKSATMIFKVRAERLLRQKPHNIAF